ncbi:MAG: sensor histidine kinase [Planctomycetota bacterium]
MLRLSLRAKIMICCIGLVALLDLMVVVFVRTHLSKVLRADYLAKGRNMAINLAADSQHFVLTQEYVSLFNLVKDLKESDEDITYAYVADRKGDVLAHTFSGGFPVDLVSVNRPEPGDAWKHELLDTVEEGPVHDTVVPILQGKVGFVHIGISEHRIRRTISDFTLALVAIAGFVLLVGVGLSAVVSSVVTQPVRNLIKAAQKIRDGDLGQRVVATTKDEIGDLVASFNQMSDELLKQHKVLDDRNRRIRTAQEQATWERNKLRAIIDSMVEGVIFVDTEDKIALCNASAERIWQRSAQQLLGKPMLECHPSGVRPKILQILEEARKKPGFAFAHAMGIPEGTCLSSYSSVHSQDNRYLGLVLLSLDISERMALENEHKRLREQLFQQEKMVLIGQIAASVAHELNTPLGTILLRAQLVPQQIGSGSDLSDLKVIESEAKRCRRIVDSLLGFSRRSEGVISRASVNSLVRESLSLVENDLTLKGILIETDYSTNEITVEVDCNQMQQVLLNLITNAIDAMPEGGRLWIATRLLSDNGNVEIQVRDSGCGMDEDVQNQAFEAFFTTKERGKGTGLGLAICQRIVEEHEGKIKIQSRPNRGTTVSIHLPYIPMEITDEQDH